MKINLKYFIQYCVLLPVLCMLWSCSGENQGQETKRPNILFVIADDQSYPYASIYGTQGVQTPAFDEAAKNGILFKNAFTAAPQCSPSRAAILTGKNIWQLEEAGTHSSYFPKKFEVFPDLLEAAGYKIGFTGKGWAPGNWKDAGWKRNPAGPEYSKEKLEPPTKDISKTDYFRNFVDFYNENKKGDPFFFWFGAHEPHRSYAEGSGLQSGKNLNDAFVPGFLPDDSVVRSDIEDYALEIEWFDTQLGKMVNFLKEKGQLNNTLIVITSDNGMPFPSAKANLMEYGSHVPLAISWPDQIKGITLNNDLVSLVDLAPTFLGVAGVKKIPAMTGKSLSDILFSDSASRKRSHREYVLTGRERHSDSRPDNLGYPSRAIRTQDFLFILNFKPDRWPAGNPAPSVVPVIQQTDENLSKDIKPIGLGYSDIDDSPTKIFMMGNKNTWPQLFAEGYEKRPAQQLFDIQRDPYCQYNLADNPEFDSVKNKLKSKLENLLREQGDPRMMGNGDIFESYPRFALMRNWGGFQKRGEYNPAYQKKDSTLNNQ